MQAAQKNSRTSRRFTGPVLRPIAYCVALACCELAGAAQPTGPTVVNGTALMQGVGSNHLKITNSPGAIINWQGFSIAAGNKTEFIQQSAASAVLNRVVGADISKIDGSLLSNGRVFLINPAGILIGAGAVIDTGGFVGSTLQMQNADFLAGKLKFQAEGSAGSITNNGTIMARHGGNVVLIAPQIENGEKGVLQTEGGQLILAAGKKLTIASLDHEGVQFEVQAPADSVLNVGKMIADGGAIGVFAGTLKHSGDIRAGGITRDAAGRVVLKAQGDVTLAAGSTTSANGKTGGAITLESASGTAVVSGTVTATGSAGKGGDVRVLGDRAGVLGNAVIDASGDLGGGQILIGGDFQGLNPEVRNASQSLVGSKALLRADAITSGDGGKVIVWADGFTRFNGTIKAQGGAQGGNGGFAETSGHETLIVGETARVHLGAPRGSGGTWLLDPKNIRIADVGTARLDQVDEFTDDPGTDFTISPATLLLVTNNMDLQANNDITFDDPINHTRSEAPTFTARAGRSIFVNANISFVGDVTLVANESTGSTGGGVIAAQRDQGIAQLTMATGTSIVSDGNVRLVMSPGAFRTADPLRSQSGDITVANVTANSGGNVLIYHDGPTADGKILRADGTSLITGASVALDVNGPGGAGSIGTHPEPMRIRTPAVEARTRAASGGIFLASPLAGNLQVGGAALTVALGDRGVRALAGGPIEIVVNGNLTRSADPLVPGRISAWGGVAGVGGNIVLDAAQLGTQANRLHVDAGDPLLPLTSTVSATSRVGSIYLEQVDNTVLLSKYSFSTPGGVGGSDIHLARVNGTVSVDTNISLPGRNLTLIADDVLGAMTFTGPITIDAAQLIVPVQTAGAPTVSFPSGVVNLDVPTTIGLPLIINGGTANFNQTSTATAGLSLLSGTLGGSALLTVTGASTWSGGNMTGTGQTTINGPLTIDTNDTARTFVGRTLLVDGPVTWSDSGTISSNGGTFTVRDGTTITGDPTWTSTGPGAATTRFNNDDPVGGRVVGLTRNTSTGVAALDNLRFSNSGAGDTQGPITVATGTLRLGGAMTAVQGSTPSAISVANNATVEFAGGDNETSGAVTGLGRVLVSGVGNFEPKGDMTVGTLEVTGGTVLFTNLGPAYSPTNLVISGGQVTTAVPITFGGGSMSGGALGIANGGNTGTLNPGGTFNWTGGALQGSGTFVVSGPVVGGATLNISGSPQLEANANLRNQGTVNWTGGTITSGVSGIGNTIENQGTWNATGTTSAFVAAGGSGITFTNSGTGQFNRNGAGITGLAIPFNNNGTVTVNLGGLTLSGGGTTTSNVDVAGGTLLLDGTGYTFTGASNITGANGIVLFNNGTVDVGGGYDLGAGATTRITNGTFNYTNALVAADPGGTLEMTGGVLTGAGAVNATGAVNWGGGTVTGAGAFTTGGATTISGPVTLNDRTWTNNGQVTLTTGVGPSEGRITLLDNAVINNTAALGASWTLSSAAPIPITGGGTFNNIGTFNSNAPTAATTYTVSPTEFHNTGAVNVNEGTLAINANGTHSGTFTVAGTKLLDFAGGAHTFAAPGGVQGPGTVRFSAGSGTFTTGAVGNLTALQVAGPTVTIDATATYDAATTRVSSGAFVVDAAAATTGAMTLEGGTVRGGGALTVTGNMDFTGGTIESNVTVNGVTAVNTGAAVIDGTLATSRFNMTSGSLDVNLGAQLTITGALPSTITGGALTNRGGIEVTGTGTLASSGAATLVSSGVFGATGADIIHGGATQTFENNSTFSGAGINRMTNGATFTGTIQSGNVRLEAGDFAGNALFDGTVGWQGGNIVGAYTINDGAFLNLANGAKAVAGGSLATAATGTIRLTNTDNLVLRDGATLANAGTIDFQNNGNIVGAGTTSTFLNTGTIQKTLVAGTSSIQNGVNPLVFNNSGDLDAQVGTLNYAATNTFNAGTQFLGAGLNTVNGNSTFNGAISSVNLRLVSGNFGGTASLDGVTAWQGGTIAGSYTIPNTGRLNVTGPGVLSGTTLTNNGLVDIQALGSIRLFDGADFSTLVNNNTLDINSNAGGFPLFSDAATQNGNVINAGTVNVNTGSSFETRFSNSPGGTLRINNAGTTLSMQNGRTFNGNIEINSATATLWISEIHGAPASFDGTIITGPGALLVQGGGFSPVAQFNNVTANTSTLRVGSQGTVNVIGATTFGNLIVNGGTLAGTATLAVSADATFSAGTISNTAGVNAGGATTWSGGQLTGLLNIGGLGTLDVPAGGAASINGATAQLTNNGMATIDGTLTLSGGGAFVNNNTVTWNGGDIAVGAGSTLTNSGGATFNMNTTVGGTGITGPGSFDNDGILNVNAPGLVTLIGTAFSNRNTVNVDGGTLRLTADGVDGGAYALDAGTLLDLNSGVRTVSGAIGGPGGVQVSGATFTATGPWNQTALTVQSGVATFGSTTTMAPSSITLSGGDATFNAQVLDAGPLTISGAATTVSFNQPLDVQGAFTMSGGSANFADTSIAGASTLSGGTLGGIGGQTFFADNGLTFTGGVIAGNASVTVGGTTTINGGTPQVAGTLNADGFDMTAGTLSIVPGGVLNLAGAGAKTLVGARIDNDGLINLGGTAHLLFNENGVINNGGVFDIKSDVGIQYTVGTAVTRPVFTNLVTGTLRKSGGSGTSTIGITLPIDFVNDGAIDAQTGTLVHASRNTFNSGTTFTGAGANVVAGNSTFNGAITSANLTLQSGNFGGVASFDGTTGWTGGTITGQYTVPATGSLEAFGALAKVVSGPTASLVNNGTLDISGNGNLVVQNGALIRNNNLAAWTGGTGSIQVNAGANFINAADGTMTLNTDVNNTGVTGAGTFLNAGGLVVNAPGVTTLISTVFDNSGNVNVNQGTLRLTGAGTDTGTYAVGPGTLEFAGGTRDLNGTAVLSGAGAIVVSGGTLNVNTPMTIGNPFTLTGGNGVTLGGSGDVTLTGPFTWSGGADIRGIGLLTTTGSTTISGIENGIDKNWTNTGTVDMDATGALNSFVGNSTFRNQGTFNMASTVAAPFSRFSGSLAVVNESIFNKTGAGIQTIQDTTFTNTATGTLNVQAGTLAIPTFSANAGMLKVLNGATFTTNGANSIVNTGTIAGNGTIDVGPGQTVFNDGTVAPGASPGALTIAGDYTQGPGGTLVSELGGTTQGVTYDVLHVTGTANLGGALVTPLVNGFVPAEGDMFTLLTSANSTGAFATTQLPPGATAVGTPQAFTVVVPVPTNLMNANVAMDESTRLNERFVDNAEIRSAEAPKGGAIECN